MLAHELPDESPEQLASTEMQEFDYTTLDTETRIIVQQRTTEIRTLVHRQTQDAFDIGQKLLEVKSRLGHGYFGSWLEAEFEWSWDTANHFMNVAKHIGQIPNDSEFEARALYLLASPSTSEEARQEAKERASRGEKITFSKAKVIRSRHNHADAVQNKVKPKQATVDVPAFTLERESPSSDGMELLGDESEFAEIEPTRYATPPQTSETVGNHTVEEEKQNDQELAEEEEVTLPESPDQVDQSGQYFQTSTQSQQVDRTKTIFPKENEESSEVAMTSKQSEQELDETVEVRASQTTFEKIYSFLISQAKEYVPNFPNARFSEVDKVIKQIAEDTNFRDFIKSGQLGQKQLEEVRQAFDP